MAEPAEISSPPAVLRIARVIAVFSFVVGLLYVRFAMGLFRENEVSRVVHWGMLPIAGLLGFAAWAFEMTGNGSEARRDALWGISTGVAVFSAARILGFV